MMGRRRTSGKRPPQLCVLLLRGRETDPQKAWTGEEPGVSKFMVFGCQAVVLIPPAQWKSKVDPIGERMVHIRHDQEAKGYLFYDPRTKRALVSRDTAFLEALPVGWVLGRQQGEPLPRVEHAAGNGLRLAAGPAGEEEDTDEDSEPLVVPGSPQGMPEGPGEGCPPVDRDAGTGQGSPQAKNGVNLGEPETEDSGDEPNQRRGNPLLTHTKGTFWHCQ